MIVDNRSEFCDASSLSLTAGTWTNVGKQIDLNPGASATNPLAPNVLINSGETPVYLILRIVTSVIGAVDNTGTVTFRLASDDSTSISATTSTVHLTSSALQTSTSAVAASSAGVTVFAIALPRTKTYERFLGIQALATTRNVTAGAIDAFLTDDISTWAPYADAVLSQE